MRQEQCECGRPSIRHDGACSRCAAIEKRLELDFHRATCGVPDDVNRLIPGERFMGLSKQALSIANERGCVTSQDLGSNSDSASARLSRLAKDGLLVRVGRRFIKGYAKPLMVYAPA